ncbi:MAG TPA: type II toxin-antitoxin system VapC family toxin [Thermodesulfobacteriota bacterium]|nr:type II toxin-antitoxin system VapC family toxin [Thermodesulfobacteriota bacterium]
MNYILDAWAVMAWLGQENGYLRVRELLKKAGNKEIKLSISIVNFGEVFYRTGKLYGIAEATRTEKRLRALPINIVAPLEERLVMRAAYLKAQHPISYADAFAAALTEQEKAILITGDPDFKRIEKTIRIEWLI